MRDALIKLGYFTLILFVLYGVWSFFFRLMGNNNIDELLRKTDTAIAGQEYQQAYQYLRSISRHRLSAYQRLRILARAFELGDAINDFSYLEKESASAMRAYKNREDFKAFYIFALLENGKTGTAAQLAQKHLQDLQFKDIRSRAILSNLFKDSPDPYLAAQEELSSNVNIEYYTQMANLLNEPILFFNVALLHVLQQQHQPAKALLPMFIYSDEVSITKRALLAYELGESALALSLLENLPLSARDSVEATLLLADLELNRGNHLQALELYRTALAMDARFSAVPWLNVALLTEQFYPNSAGAVYSTLLQGFNQFPSDTHLMIALVQRNVQQQQAMRDLREFIERYPFDARAYLFFLNHFPNDHQLESISTHLWDLFNYNAKDAQLTRYMIWFFLGQRNFDDAWMVLERYQGMDRSWMSSYEALIEALEENFSRADRLLHESEQSWENLYNRAVILSVDRHYEQAISHLISAAAIYRASVPNQFDRRQFARIQAKLAEVYMLSGQFAMANSAADEALRSDDENVAALEIIKTLSRVR